MVKYGNRFAFNCNFLNKMEKHIRSDKFFRSFSKKKHFSGVTLDDIANELREAYANNEKVLECYKEEYTRSDNRLFFDFVQELVFVKRNVSNVIPTDEAQFSRLLMKLLQ